MSNNEKQQNEYVVLYHAECFDGRMASWTVFNSYFNYCLRDQFTETGNVVTAPGIRMEFIPISYDDQLPDLTDKTVYIVDFSCDVEKLVEVAASSKGIYLLDHHATMRDKFLKYHKDNPDVGIMNVVEQDDNGIPVKFEWNSHHLNARFNNKASGAMISWKYFNGNVNNFFKDVNDAPTMIRIAQDYDLFKFEFPGTREIATSMYDCINSISMIELTKIIEAVGDCDPYSGFNSNDKLSELYQNGVVIFKHQKTLARGIIKRGMQMETVTTNDGKTLCIPVCQVPRELRTLVGEILATEHPFSITYEDYPSRNIREYSFRSNKNFPGWVDVKEFAESQNGSGHVHSAGVRIEHHSKASQVLIRY